MSENGGGFVPAKAVIPVSAPNPTRPAPTIARPAPTSGRGAARLPAEARLPPHILPARSPKTFGAGFSNSTFAGPPSNGAITRTTLLINGKEAFSANGGSATINPGPRYTKLFKDGPNTIEIRIVKRVKQGTTLGQCRHGANPSRPLGINFALYGEFEADLWLSKDRNVTEEVSDRRQPGNRGPTR